jgi:hypothetical protein
MSIPDIDYVLGFEVGQFEYAVPLSPVKPEDMERLAKEYLENKKQNELKGENERLIPSSTSTDRGPR